ncbi:hypothetical protein ARALYDRAFT_904516 [Arabidopsis lyrata subsp. lyrata]|uniref:F-box associated beta-propeller type 3 domain-containing protein n=1 Tax=Arabidopsis lyrata subsp. lyrata TaxID=81972 RepID=D7LQ70_ARALL|nr:hypothetical protein ARALYDRAFT_904513 [Arabidopsis lyrata subsp. lyrata]EFH53095.1 hypothetical protein ARALYDRAFT_904516 [Arabidopsis lyrata subsp. lyrata]
MGEKWIGARSYFGFDPIDKHFKVLCLGLGVIVEKYQVMTLGIGKLSWRMIECCKAHYPLYDGICINGVLYYRAEVKRGSFWTLINYKGKLGAVDKKNATCFRFLVLEDANNHKFSMHIVNMMPDLLRAQARMTELCLVGATSSGEIMLPQFYLSDPFYVYYYNFKRNAFIRVRIQGLEALDHTQRVHTFLDYVEDVCILCKCLGIFL